MAGPARGDAETQGDHRAASRGTLFLALLFVLAAVTVSAGLVVYTAWLHDLENGPFALLFAVLSSKAALSWHAWNEGDDSLRPPNVGAGPKQD